MYNLANNPEAQQKVFDEIRHVIGDDPEKPVYQKDLNDLNYLDLCIKETLRLFPSVPFYGRKIPETIELSKRILKFLNYLKTFFKFLDGKTIPAGTNVGIGPYFMGRSEELWKNPLKFEPERFDIDNLKMHPYGHVPFSAGPRNVSTSDSFFLIQCFAIFLACDSLVTCYKTVRRSHKLESKT